MKSFKLTYLAVAVCGAVSSSLASAEQYPQQVNPVISGQDEVVIGTKENPLTNAVIVNDQHEASIDVNHGGSISIYGSGSGVRFFQQGKKLTIGSEGAANLNIYATTNPFYPVTVVDLQGGETSLVAQNINIVANPDVESTYQVVGINNAANLVMGSMSKDSKVSISAFSDNGPSYAIINMPNSTLSIDASEIELLSSGMAISNQGELNIGSDLTKNLTIKSSAKDKDAVLVAVNGLANFVGDTISVDGGHSAVKLQQQSEAKFSGGEINISSGSDAGFVVMQSRLEISADTLNIQSSESDGIAVQGNTADSNTSISIDAGKTEITAEHGAGIMATSYGKIDIKGNLLVNASEAITARGDAVVNINQEGNGTVVLNGDIAFVAGNDPNSGKSIDADINVNLVGEGSSWTGSLIRLEVAGEEPQTISKGLDLTLADGATWEATVYKGTTPEGGVLNNQAVENLKLDGGVVSATESGQSVAVNNLSLTKKGGVFNAPAAEGEGGSLTSAQLSVANATAEEGSTMTVNYTGITSDQINAENQDDLNAFVAKGIEVKETAQEGDINGAWERKTLADGTISVTQAANTKLTDFSSVNAMSLVQWRNEINHLTKRLGDIRVSEGTIGAWARVYGGESQWGGANEVEMDHTTIQVGGDYRINNHWIAGAAFSYTDSRADLSNGDADGDSYSLAIYGTYTADGGSFLDLIGRYGYLKNDITAGNMALDTSSSAFSLSAEMGHTFRFINDAAYVEPQIEFTYGFIGGDAATATNNVRIEQDDFQSFVTRVGVRAGYDFPQKKGSVYGMFSYSYDWMGDADGTASKDGLRQALSQDLGGGWITYGVGAQIMLGDSAYFYGELERTSGGDIDNPYLFSAGVRMTF